jgi:MFS transporter, DHA1 family, tetracycline resistance protein
MVAASFFVAGFGMGLCFPALSALAANSVDGPEQGACAAAMSMAQGMSMVSAPVLGALLYDVAPAAPFVLMAMLTAAVLVSALRWNAADARSLENQ